jgi:outer membrane biosynthesis protein TonB
LLVQVSFLLLLAFAGNSRGAVIKELVLAENEIPVEVMPVLDDLPLLKLGSKNPLKPRLPDMWQKREPRPVKRYEERSAPSSDAEDSVEEIPDSEIADKTHEAPPVDGEIIKEVEQVLEEDPEPEEAVINEEGAADGSKDGTETDPLKARHVDLYRAKIAGWFNARFRPPVDSVPCEVLKQLSASVSVQVGGDRRVVGSQITQASGNPTFDAKVQSTLNALTGEQLPPPPQLYPDILGGVVYPRLSGAGACP